MTRPSTPLPELERELVAAARRRETARAPKRRAWLHGWALVGVVLATTGVAGVAVARVAEVGPFAYLGRFASDNPKTAPVSAITVQPDGPEPAWQAIAVIDKLDRLCFTGGPRDPRTNPAAKPTDDDLNNPPNAGYTCSDDSDEAAEMLIDPDRPGATFGGFSPANGSPDGNQGYMDPKTHKFVRLPQQDPTTKLLVYAVAPESLGTVVARWGAKGKAIPMQRSKDHLRLKIDKSPEGLDRAEQAQVARYPDEVDLVLWATVVDIPKGVKDPQVAYPSELPPHGVDDATVELLSVAELMRIDAEGRKNGWKHDRGITREPQPVKSESAAERERIAAFARPHTNADVVPEDERPEFYSERNRVQWNASRKFTVAGGGVDDAWIAPGALDPSMEFGNRSNDLVCLVGPAILGDCKYGVGDWKHALVEAVACSKSFTGDETFLWAISPPGATRIELRKNGVAVERFAPAELVALRRPYADQPDELRWIRGGGTPVTVRVPWPKRGTAACGKGGSRYTVLRRDSLGGSSMSGGPRPTLHAAAAKERDRLMAADRARRKAAKAKQAAADSK